MLDAARELGFVSTGDEPGAASAAARVSAPEAARGPAAPRRRVRYAVAVVHRGRELGPGARARAPVRPDRSRRADPRVRLQAAPARRPPRHAVAFREPARLPAGVLGARRRADRRGGRAAGRRVRAGERSRPARAAEAARPARACDLARARSSGTAASCSPTSPRRRRRSSLPWHDALDEPRRGGRALRAGAGADLRRAAERSTPSVAALAARRERSPVDLVRHAGIVLGVSRIGPGFSRLDAFEDAMHALPHVEDPLVRTGFTANYSYALGIQAKYEPALEVACLLLADVEAFDLEFARPHAHWNLAFALPRPTAVRRRRAAPAAGRRLGQAAATTATTPSTRGCSVPACCFNSRSPTRRSSTSASTRTRRPFRRCRPNTSRRARSCWPCLGRSGRARWLRPKRPRRRSVSCEVRVLAQPPRGRSSPPQAGDVAGRIAVVELADRLQVWDPLVVALRSEPALWPTCSRRRTRSGRSCSSSTSRRTISRCRAGRASAPGRAECRRRSCHARELEVLGLMAARPQEQGDRRGARDRRVDDQGARAPRLREARRADAHRGGGALPDVRGLSG